MTDPVKEPFYVVSMGKFSTLFFCTLGMYGIYWFYRMFQAMEIKTGRNLFPAGRALFSVFFVHGLFDFVRNTELTKESDRPWSPNTFAWIFIGTGVFQLLLGYVGDLYDLGPLFKLCILLAALFVQFYVIYQVQLAVNRIASDPFGRANAKMDTRNKIWIVVGAYIWASYIFHVYLEQTGQTPQTYINGAPSNQTEESVPPLY